MGSGASKKKKNKKAIENNNNPADILNASANSQAVTEAPNTPEPFSFQGQMAQIQSDFDDVESDFVGLHRNVPSKTCMSAISDYLLADYSESVVPQLAKTLLLETPGVAEKQTTQLEAILRTLSLSLSVAQDFQAIHTDFTFGGTTEWVRIFFVCQKMKLKHMDNEWGVKLLWSKISYTWKEHSNWRLLENFWKEREGKISNWMQYQCLKSVDETFSLEEIEEQFRPDTLEKALPLAKAKAASTKRIA